MDASPVTDAGRRDSAVQDSGSGADGGVDSGAVDSGAVDSGAVDSGAVDSGPAEMDAGGLPTLTVVNTSTGGVVTSMPGNIMCGGQSGGPCAASFAAGTSVTLTASAASGYVFSTWSGDCSGAAPSATVTMSGDRACTASFVGTGGAIQVISPPSSVVPNVTEDPTNILVFRERTAFRLPSGVPLDMHVPDDYGPPIAAPGTFPAGLSVNVYFVHFDPTGTSPERRRSATLTFSDPIVGLITSSGSLDSSDPVLGLGSVTYPQPGDHGVRGTEVGLRDSMTFANDRRRVSVDLRTGFSADQMRIITLTSPDDALAMLVSGAVRTSSAPRSVEPGRAEDGQRAIVFEESRTTLQAQLTVDIAAPGTYSSPAAIMGGQLASGTAVTSYLVHVDPPATDTVSVDLGLTFDRAILGLIVLGPTLVATDAALGHANVTYSQVAADRTTNLDASDTVYFSADGRSLRLRLSESAATDQIRVVLAD